MKNILIVGTYLLGIMFFLLDYIVNKYSGKQCTIRLVSLIFCIVLLVFFMSIIVIDKLGICDLVYLY